MSSDYYWMAYKWFYDPPGQPYDLRCVGCKYTAAAGLSAVGVVSAVGAYKTISRRPFLGMTFCFGTVFSVLGSAVAVRLGVEDKEYNRRRIKEHAAEIKRKRRELSGVDQK